MDQKSGRGKGADITDTDIANGRRLWRAYGQDLHYTPEHGWLVWDEKRWAPDPAGVRVQTLGKHVALSIYDEVKDAADKNEVYKHARASQSRRAIESMMWCARSEPGVPAVLTQFDADPWLLNVANGTIDLRKGELREHRRADGITKLTPIKFDVGAACPRWDAFIRQVTLEDAELADYLQRMVGYFLTGHTWEQVLHFLFGLGANGKSVFCEILAELLGEYAVVASPEMLMAKRHGGIPNDVATLRGARLALMNETSQGAAFDEAKLKDLTGSDTLNARFLRAEFFNFKPTHKLVIRGNHKPAISGTDDGIWRRVRLVLFGRLFLESEQDPRLLEKLKSELPGILAWAVRGCLRWQEIGLRAPAVISQASTEYRVDSDTLGNFIGEKCEQRKLAQVKSGVFYRAYQKFARELGERFMPAKDLPHEMRRRGFEWKRTMHGGMYFGIELRQSEQKDWRDDDD